MSLMLNLSPSIETGLLAQARARALSLEGFAQQVLEEYGNARQPAIK